ncbi:MAG: response regulator transcription factor [Acaryochloridaceae cyanobacterium RU_4_10]|nr:response regulator transcription factor [Acaryochloridaceae cyanobacterium RU_4_10]
MMRVPVAARSTILIALSDTVLCNAMNADLEKSGYEVVLAPKLADVLPQKDTIHPDLIVIDEDLEKGSGLNLCKELRLQGTTIPLLIVMNSDTVDDRVACLQAGADDYFVKPYRSETFLRLIRLYLQPSGTSQGEYLKFDNLVLDLGTRAALRAGKAINLTMKEYDLLKYLMEHPREILTREQILENVWGFDFLGESNVIEVYIRYLRLKIEGEGDKKLIHTIRGVGYALRDA